jgi:type II secretory pathway component PulL
VIGFIDWTENSLSLFVFDKKGSRISLIDKSTVPVDNELDETVISSLVKTNVDRVYLSVPVHLLSLRELTLPFTDKSKIKDTISYELEGILLNSPGDYCIDHHIIKSSGNSSLVLAVCIEKTRLKEIIDLFLSAGLEPVVVTSLDLSLTQGNIDSLLENPETDETVRREAAKQELVHPTVNLRQGELVYKGDIDRLRKTFRYASVLLLILVLIVGSDIAVRFASAKKENKVLTKKITSLYQRAFPGDKKIVDPVRQFKGNLNKLREKKNIFVGSPVLDIMRDIAVNGDSDVVLNEINVDRKSILIKGTALSFEKVDRLKNSFSSVFSDIRVIDSDSSPDKKIRFSITMKAHDS